MTTTSAHILSTSRYTNDRTGHRAPTGRIIRSRSMTMLPDGALKGTVPQTKTHTPPRSSMRASALGLSFVCVGIGALFGSGVLSDAPFQSDSRALVKSVDLNGRERAPANVLRATKLPLSQRLPLKVTSDDVPFKSLQKPGHTLEFPSVRPVQARYRERLATFTTSDSLSAPAMVVPTRYAPSGGVTQPYRSHITSRVHSIILKHAPKNRNSKVLAEAIVREALAQNYDPLFVAAVIKTESLFNPVARSNKGAQGLMQIMPATGAWLANRESIPRQKLTDAGHNLRLGITYLKQLESEYNGDRVFTLVAYNWGPGHVEMASGGKRRIPGECLRYAVRILNDYRRWKSGVV
jgi:hypothetical protein